ncbi:MAG: cation diffusion facilitator family transporter [Lachnospiraceae bacterium]|nr:cation diffusion facilitator family transporter [Lachnospiraceae bacterium]
MMELLVHKFVRDYQNTGDQTVRTAYGVLTSTVGILCNLFLFLLKLSAGLVMGSLAVIADGFNNLSDAASSIISLIGVKMAQKPADKEHPFGHGRLEYIAAMIVAFIVVEVGLTLFRSSVGKIRNPEELKFSWIPFVFLVVSVFIKLWMGFYNRRLGKRIDSKVMLAVSADSFGDVAATSATIAAILISAFSGINIDGIAGLLVSLLVMWSGIGIIRETAAPLIGEGNDPELERSIKELVEQHDGIVGSHDLIVHNYGPGRSMASIHAEVPREVDIEESHAVIDHIERQAKSDLDVNLVIHMDPVEIHDERVLAIRDKLGRILTVLDERLSFHDFRAMFSDEQVNIYFDLVVPYSYSDAEQLRLRDQVAGLMREVGEGYVCFIELDRSFCEEDEKNLK